MSTPLRRRRFTVDDYYRMAAAGVLGEDDRVELIEGEIVEMSPIGSRHAGCVNRLTRIFAPAAVAGHAVVAVQNPLRLSDLSEPQPDLTVLRPRADHYASAHPRPADVLLVIEAGDSSLPVDRTVKAPIYALAGIPELWIVDLEREAVEVFRDPAPAGYRTVQRVPRGGDMRSLAFPDLTVTVDEILGPITT